MTDDEWTVHGEENIYDSPWLRLCLADVEAPSGIRTSHHLVRIPNAGAGTVAEDQGNVLLIYRFRFISKVHAWELPAGRCEEGEDPSETARRETLEETGWEPQELRHLVSIYTSPGFTDQTSHVFYSPRSIRRSAPIDTDESCRQEWLSENEIRRLIRAGKIVDGFSLSGLLFYLNFRDELKG